jgi:glutathione-regulated potassium-efflux system ancillary protein KefC
MLAIYFVASFWFLSALISTTIASRLKITNALRFKKHRKEKWYYTLLMSSGPTVGTISALYGLTNNIINTEQYSMIIGVVIASAVVPTLIANKSFLPEHLVEKPVLDDQWPDIINEKK